MLHKRIIAIALSAVLTVSMSVCGAVVTTSDTVQNNDVQTDTTTSNSSSAEGTYEVYDLLDLDHPSITADEKIQKFLNCDKYVQANNYDKKIIADKFVDRLKSNGEISDVSYDEDTNLYSFKYLDGTLGGFKIQ